jgi:acid phosphatase (class A)
MIDCMNLRLRSFAALAIVIGLGTGFLHAKEGMDSGKVSLHYLAPKSVDFVKLLPAPPKPETDEAKQEMEVVLRVQERRTPAEVARAESEAKLTMSAFTPVVGKWFTAENLPLTAKLIKAAEADSKSFSAAAKDHFGRMRPPNDARVKPTIHGEDEPSYPSGHATRGMLFGLILAELDPEQRDALMDRAREIGWDRVIAGVHFPSDLVAGRVLGQAIFQGMSSNPGFQKDLEAAKAEFIAAKMKAARE